MQDKDRCSLFNKLRDLKISHYIDMDQIGGECCQRKSIDHLVIPDPHILKDQEDDHCFRDYEGILVVPGCGCEDYCSGEVEFSICPAYDGSYIDQQKDAKNTVFESDILFFQVFNKASDQIQDYEVYYGISCA